MSKPNYLHVILTLNVLMLFVLVVMHLDSTPLFGQSVHASPSMPSGMSQRGTMIAELRQLNATLDRHLGAKDQGGQDLAKLQEEIDRTMTKQQEDLIRLLTSGRVKVTLSDRKEPTSSWTTN